MKQNKVEFEHINALVGSLSFMFSRIGDSTVTVCCAFLPNGFQVSTGESSCVDPANYDQDLGEKYAKERAINAAKDKLWDLEGYLLKVTGKTSDGHDNELSEQAEEVEKAANELD